MALVAYCVLGALLHGGALLAPRNPPSRAGAVCASADELRSFLADRAGVAPQYLEKVLEQCDAEMIGSVGNLAVARDVGLLPKLFKPVVALGIERALGPGPNVDAAAAELRALLPPPDAAAAAPSADLEVEPYHAILPNLPLNTFKPKAPLAASIISAKRIVGADAPTRLGRANRGGGSGGRRSLCGPRTKLQDRPFARALLQLYGKHRRGKLLQSVVTKVLREVPRETRLMKNDD